MQITHEDERNENSRLLIKHLQTQSLNFRSVATVVPIERWHEGTEDHMHDLIVVTVLTVSRFAIKFCGEIQSISIDRSFLQ